jgi:hypothetical protein
MPRNNQRTDVSRQELQRLEARLTSLAGRTARQASDSDALPVDAVDTVNIANDAVTEDKIADGAVTFKKLASGGTTSGGGGNYSSQAETRRSGATTTTEIYYTARPDGDGYAENEVTTSTPAGAVIERRLYYSDKFDADPDTSGDWTAYTTQPADDTAFATAKAALLAGLSDTDGTANTRGTLPVSLKMEHQFVTDLLLEDYPGAAAAYSVRKIRSAYTGDAMRIREDGGNTETDIGFDSNGDLDTAAIATHCGSANGYVVTWYDQSGNANNATQSTTTQQPQIYNGSAVITENGKPAIAFDGSNDQLDSGLTVSTTNLAVSSVQKFDDVAGGQISITVSFGSSDTLYMMANFSANSWTLKYRTSSNTAVTADTNQNLISFYTDGSATSHYKNGATLGPVYTAAAISSSLPVRIGAFAAGGYNTDLNCQELIIWQSDQSSNRTGIDSNVNTYFSIY